MTFQYLYPDLENLNYDQFSEYVTVGLLGIKPLLTTAGSQRLIEHG